MPRSIPKTPPNLHPSAFRIPHSAFISPRPLTLLLALLALSTLTVPAWAMFEVKDPLSKMYNVESKSVYVGTISAYDTNSHILTVKPFSAYKGAPLTADSLRIEIKAPAALFTEIHVGHPIVIFQGPRAAAFHVADHWYAGQVLGKPNIFLINTRIGRPAHTPHDESFPGTTAELIRALDELKTGKSTLLDKFPDKLFPAPVKQKFSLPANATGFAAIQIKDANPAMLIVATAAGLQALVPDKGALKNITAEVHLNGLKPTLVAHATIAGHEILILDKDVYELQNAHFQKVGLLHLPAKNILGLAIDRFSDDKQFEIALLTKTDLLRISFFSAFQMLLGQDIAGAFPLTAATVPSPTANGERLTGTILTDFHPAHKNGFGDHAALAAVDLNNDHRPDLIILTPTGTLTLLNRGFGGFLVNKDDAAPLLDPAATGKPQLPLLASTPDTLWLLEKDGTLYRYSFPNK